MIVTFGLKALFVSSLVKLLVETENPKLCAGIYTGGVFVLNLLFGSIFGQSLIATILITPVVFGLSFAYFWMLDRLDALSLPWWIVLLGGLFIGLV